LNHDYLRLRLLLLLGLLVVRLTIKIVWDPPQEDRHNIRWLVMPLPLKASAGIALKTAADCGKVGVVKSQSRHADAGSKFY